MINEVPDVFQDFKKLEYLNLAHNRLKSLPTSFRSLEGLKELYLCENQLEIFPEEICALIGLKGLSLNDNQIASIPNTIGQMKSLYYLDLSNNKLRHLPHSISDLKHSWGLLRLQGNPDFQNEDYEKGYGRNALRIIFEDRVVFDELNDVNFVKIKEKDALSMMKSQKIYWNLEELKKIYNPKVPECSCKEQEMISKWKRFEYLIIEDDGTVLNEQDIQVTERKTRIYTYISKLYNLP